MPWSDSIMRSDDVLKTACFRSMRLLDACRAIYTSAPPPRHVEPGRSMDPWSGTPRARLLRRRRQRGLARLGGGDDDFGGGSSASEADERRMLDSPPQPSPSFAPDDASSSSSSCQTDAVAVASPGRVSAVEQS